MINSKYPHLTSLLTILFAALIWIIERWRKGSPIHFCGTNQTTNHFSKPDRLPNHVAVSVPHNSELSFDQGHLESGFTADFTDEPKGSLAFVAEINTESDRYFAGDFSDYEDAEMSSIY
jgi:hypothetical protein